MLRDIACDYRFIGSIKDLAIDTTPLAVAYDVRIKYVWKVGNLVSVIERLMSEGKQMELNDTEFVVWR